MAPKRKGKGQAAAAQAPCAFEDAQAEHAKVLSKWHHNIQSVKRIFDANNQHPVLAWPGWFDTNNDYSITSHPNPPLSDVKAGKQAKEHEKFGYPNGVLVNFLFKSTMGASNELAPYLAFKGILEMNSYIDIIAVDQDLSFQEFVKPFNEDFEGLLEEHKNGGVNPGKALAKPSPIKCLQDYSRDGSVQRFIDQVVTLCTKPTFIPVLNKHIASGGLDSRAPRQIAPKAFVLAHTVQILLFAPMTWDYTREYSRDRTTYPHRFPTPPEVGGGTNTCVADLSSMEDLYRAICMFYQLISRRIGRTAWIGRGVGPKKSVGFPGYVSPALKHLADVPEVAQSSTSEFRLAEAVEMEASLFLEEEHADFMSEGLGGLDSVDVNTSLLELVQPSRIPAHQNAEASALQDMEPISAANFAAEIRLLKRLHKQPDFDAILERRRKTITNVTDFIEDSDIDEFINRQSASELVSEFAREHPDDIDELMNLSRQQYALEHVLSSIQPVTNLDLDQLCDEHSIAPWPELKLYTGDRATAIQGLKPHQVNDAAAIVARGFADYKHTFLSNDMGTGKTKTCFTAIELTHRKKLKQYQSGMEQYGKSDVKFHPTLIFTAVNSIFQTWKEGKDHFPTMNLYVYYGTSSSDFPDTKAKVINTGDFKDELNASSVADSNPETGLIVIISTYPTWSRRNVLKLERPFVFKAGKRPVSRQKDARLIENDSDEEVDIELLNNLPKYHVSEITRDNIRFLTEDTASAAEKPDGCLIEYSSRQSALDSIVFEHVIADDAHLAKKPNGVYNHILQLIN
ncbi:hypothetical protein ACHAPK_009665 [Fusarium culmorum]